MHPRPAIWKAEGAALAPAPSWRARWPLAWLGCLVVLAGAACEDEPARPGPLATSRGPRPDVVLVVVDALRADRLGVYGGPAENSPTIDAIAREGVTFERAIAQAPWTQPSVASLLSSLYPSFHGVQDFQLAMDATYGDAPKIAVFGNECATLPETLRAHGYRTAAFVANPFLDTAFGFSRGFDHFDASFAALSTRGRRVNEAAVGWIRAREPGVPVFLYLHYMDVHGPYDARPGVLDPMLDALERSGPRERLDDAATERLGYLRTFPSVMRRPERHAELSRYREYWVARYDAGIREMDGYLAALRHALEVEGVWRDALVVITADHGEALFEHGLWDHGKSLHDTELHVPLIVRWPGVAPAGTRVRAAVELIDVMPTILDLLGIDAAGAGEGRSVGPLLTGGSGAAPEVAIAEAVKGRPGARAIYAGDWKLITDVDGGAALYDLAHDPLETHDVGAARVTEAARLRRLLADHAERAGALAARRPAVGAAATPAQVERLRALGYLEPSPSGGETPR